MEQLSKVMNIKYLSMSVFEMLILLLKIIFIEYNFNVEALL